MDVKGRHEISIYESPRQTPDHTTPPSKKPISAYGARRPARLVAIASEGLAGQPDRENEKRGREREVRYTHTRTHPPTHVACTWPRTPPQVHLTVTRTSRADRRVMGAAGRGASGTR